VILPEAGSAAFGGGLLDQTIGAAAVAVVVVAVVALFALVEDAVAALFDEACGAAAVAVDVVAVVAPSSSRTPSPHFAEVSRRHLSQPSPSTVLKSSHSSPW
jgi:hypothetical protein